MLSIGDIKRHSFEPQKSGKFYDSTEVDTFFANVTETIDAITGAYEKAKRDNEELINKIKVLSNKIEEYRTDEDNLRSALLIAQRAADSVIKEAKDEAEGIVEASKNEAEEKSNAIKAETDLYVEEKRADADKYAEETRANVDKYAEETKAEADSNLENTKKECDEIVSTAKTDAAGIVSQANKSAAEIIGRAEKRASVINENTERTIAAAQKKLGSIMRITGDFKASVIAVMNQQISLLKSIEIDEEIRTEISEEEVYHPEYTSEEYIEAVEDIPDEEDLTEEITEEPVETFVEDADEEAVETEIEEIIEEEEEEIIEINFAEEEKEPVYVGVAEKDEKPAFNDAEVIEKTDSDNNTLSSFDSSDDEISNSDISDDEDKDYFDSLMESISSQEEKEKKKSRSVFTPIINGEEQSYQKADADKNLKFGKDYDIFGEEDDDSQGSFFGRFKKK